MRWLLPIAICLGVIPAVARADGDVDALIEKLASSGRADAVAAAKELAERRDPAAIRPLVRALAERGELDHDLRAALAVFGADALPALEQAIAGTRAELAKAPPDQHTELSVRLGRLVHALGGAGPEAVAPLKGYLSSEDAGYRRADAIEALGEILDTTAVKLLIRLSKRDPYYGARLAAVRALLGAAKGQPPADGAFAAVAKALKDRDRLVRKTAAEALDELGSTEAQDALWKAASSGNPAAAASCYVRMIVAGKKKYVRTLVAALNEWGTKEMCTVFVNCGHTGLCEAGERWAFRYSYKVVTVPGGQATVRWGGR